MGQVSCTAYIDSNNVCLTRPIACTWKMDSPENILVLLHMQEDGSRRLTLAVTGSLNNQANLTYAVYSQLVCISQCQLASALVSVARLETQGAYSVSTTKNLLVSCVGPSSYVPLTPR